jgi:CBS domain-containing protein
MHQSVADVMTRNPIVVQPTTAIQEVIKLLADKRISGLPVVDAQGFLVGVVSSTDLMWQETGVTPPAYVMVLDSVIYLQNPAQYDRDLHKALGQTVAELMTPHPISITADEPLSQAARLMHDRHVQRLPVLDASKHVIGILTRGDIIHAMAAERLAVA